MISEQTAVLHADDQISQSWRRAELVGLRPEEDPRIELADVDPSSRIARAAAPVLTDIQNEITDMPIGCLLTDRHGAVLRRVFGTKQFQAIADGVGAQVGAIFDEQHTGTNALATPLEVRRPVLVEPGGHYLHSLQRFACYGVPVLDPKTRRLEGVLDLMAPAGSDTTLMKVVANRAALDISRRLVSDHDLATVASMAVFESMRCRTQNALVLIADGLVMQNSRSTEVLQQEDYVHLTGLVGQSNDVAETMDLADGSRVQVRVRAFGARAALFEIPLNHADRRVPRGGNATALRSQLISHPAQAAVAGNGHVVVAGEPGTGRTAVSVAIAQAIAPAAQVTVADLHNETVALKQLESTPITDVLVVESLEAVNDPSVLARLRQLLDTRDGSRLILTSGPLDRLTPEAAAVAARCVDAVELRPLRSRQEEFSAIAASMLREHGDPTSRLTLPALEALREQAWPGNLAELRKVLISALDRRSNGDIGVGDLPERYRAVCGRRNLTRLERAERDAIVDAMVECRRNKVQSAQRLGLSRSTLYQRLRYFGIS